MGLHNMQNSLAEIIAACARLGTTILVALLGLVAGLDTGQANHQAARGSVLVIDGHGEVRTTAREVRIAREKSRDPDAAASKIATISQQAILFAEDTSTPKGKAYFGLTTWRTRLTPSTDATTGSETFVLAEIAFPEPRMLASLKLRRNTDRSLAASHVIEISFDLPRNTPDGGINNVPGVLMKASNTAQGLAQGGPLAGFIEKVKDSSFMIALSSGEAEMQQNLRLLRDQEWIHIALVYNNGKRAILALEKGRSGDRAFAEAFDAWKQ